MLSMWKSSKSGFNVRYFFQNSVQICGAKCFCSGLTPANMDVNPMSTTYWIQSTGRTQGIFTPQADISEMGTSSRLPCCATTCWTSLSLWPSEMFAHFETPLWAAAEGPISSATALAVRICEAQEASARHGFSDTNTIQLLYFVWSPPWHLYIFLLANLLAFYLTYLLAFYLAFYLAYLLAYVLAYLLAFYLANLLAFYLAYLLVFYLTYLLAFYLHIFWHSIWHIFWHSIWHSIWHIFWHSIWPLRSGSAHWDLELAVGVRQCPLRPGSRGWGPAVPTAICNSRLMSGSAHWDLQLAVEVRQCPLGSGARGWGPAVPTATWKSRLRSGSAHCDLQLAVEVRQCPLGSGARGGGPAVPTGIWTARRRRRVRRRRRRRRRRRALLKSSNPHMAGAEKSQTQTRCCIGWAAHRVGGWQRTEKRSARGNAVVLTYMSGTLVLVCTCLCSGMTMKPCSLGQSQAWMQSTPACKHTFFPISLSAWHNAKGHQTLICTHIFGMCAGQNAHT